MADLTRDELDRLLASYAASGSTGWIVDVARMARASLDMVPAADFDAQVRHAAQMGEERDDARREAGQARRVLRAISYCVTDDDSGLRVCPCCGGIAPWQTSAIGDGDTIGHTTDCALAASLGKEQGR